MASKPAHTLAVARELERPGKYETSPRAARSSMVRNTHQNPSQPAPKPNPYRGITGSGRQVEGFRGSGSCSEDSSCF